MEVALDFRKSSYSANESACVEVAVQPVVAAAYSPRNRNLTEPRFRTSSFSGSGDNCVQVADLPEGAALRDSKNPQDGHLSLAATEWVAFLGAVKRMGL
ncbi:DUF397 domain-containing protein [Nocardiopsis mangrovi]|uniref:DUF397 domain-containing protein n=1 Tax=Nocardiopsis mangrovi TaxID=1179818 RepID=A0ABV9DXW8_9ACTN